MIIQSFKFWKCELFCRMCDYPYQLILAIVVGLYSKIRKHLIHSLL